MFILLISKGKGKVEEMSHLYVRQNGVGPGEYVDGYQGPLAQLGEGSYGEQGPGAHQTSGSILFFLTAHDSEAPGVGGVEGLDSWAETVWSLSLRKQDGKRHATLSRWPAHSGSDLSLAKMHGWSWR